MRITLDQLKAAADSDPVLLAKFREVELRAGELIARAVRDGDTAALEWACQRAGTYRAVVDAARRAGVDPGALEEALAAI
jgi:hypothetical protein